MSTASDSPSSGSTRRSRLTFRKIADAGFLPELIPVIPPDGELFENTRIMPSSRGKVPGKFNRYHQKWSGYNWADPKGKTTLKNVIGWDKWEVQANIGIQTRWLPTFDVDVNVKVLAEAIAKSLISHFGFAPERLRGEARRALIYRTKARLSKRRVAFQKIGDPDDTGALEMLGVGQQVVIEGTHPSGMEYEWKDDKGLPEIGAKNLTFITEEQIDEFFDVLLPAVLDLFDYEVKKVSKGSSSSSGVKYPIGDSRTAASDPKMVVEALEAWPNTAVETYEEWVEAFAAVKAAFAGDEEFYEHFEEWSLQWEKNTEASVREKWDSVHESALGADYVFERAAAFGFNWAGYEFADIELPPEEGIAADLEEEEHYRLMREVHGPDVDIPTIEEVEEDESKIPVWVKELNTDHFVVNEGGQVRVVKEAFDHGLNRPILERLKFDDFRNAYLNDEVCIGSNADGDPVYAKKGKAWLESPYRRQFLGGMVFAPNRVVPDNVYNLWRGFAVEAVPGDWSLYRQHLLEVACKGVQEHYDYLIRWMARAVQEPDRQGEVAAVLKGRKGTGKGTIIKWFGRIFGRHFLHITNAEHLVGRFNSALRDSVVVFADEAFWAGDKKHESVLKGLITEDMLFLEGKFRDPVQTPNFVHLLMASNDDWVVPASSDERRFFVLEVDDQRQQDEGWFAAIEKQMSEGGVEAFFHDLLHMDLSGFSVRQVPSTSALTEQKMMGFSPLEKWWFEHLRRGVLPGDDFDEDWPPVEGDPSLEVPVKDVSAAIEAAYRAANVRRLPASRAVGRALRRVCPGLSRKGSGARDRVYVLPALDRARRQFAEYLGSDLDWDEL